MGSGPGSLEVMGAQTDPITVKPVLHLQKHFQIFMIHQLTSLDILLGSRVSFLQLVTN